MKKETTKIKKEKYLIYIYIKYLHKLDVFNLENDFYRINKNIYGIYITEENLTKYKHNFFEYFTIFIKNKILLSIEVN